MVSYSKCLQSFNFNKQCFMLPVMSRTRYFMSTTSSENKNTSGRASAAVIQNQENKKNTEKLDLNPPKGTRDFYPEDQRLKTWLFGKWREIAALYGFEEYDSPVVESEELYIRKAGEEVTQQLYNFEDKGGRRLSLRPEMTPSLARMVLARRGGLPLPLKWFSLPQCWRYERMTRGRRREHYQWNMDIWGVEGVEAEAELLSAIVTSFKDMGITSNDVGIKINSRKLLLELMLNLGVPEDKFAAACVIVDKLEKVPLESLENDLQAVGLSSAVVGQLMSSLIGANINTLSEKLGSTSKGVQDIQRLIQLATGYGYADWLVFDPSVVRGLAYYTGIVFEGFDRKGELRAICGGGRYDALLTSFGGEPIPAVGFGFGDAVIVELLKDRGLLPDTSRGRVDVMVFAQSEALRGKAVAAATELRSQGVSVDLVLEDKKMKWAFQRADKIRAGVMVLLAQSEDNENKVIVKAMDTGEQETVDRLSLVVAVQQKLNGRIL